MEMKVNKIDHISVAVKNLEEARKIWEPILGKPNPDDPYVNEHEKIRVARYWLGEVGFETGDFRERHRRRNMTRNGLPGERKTGRHGAIRDRLPALSGQRSARGARRRCLIPFRQRGWLANGTGDGLGVVCVFRVRVDSPPSCLLGGIRNGLGPPWPRG